MGKTVGTVMIEHKVQEKVFDSVRDIQSQSKIGSRAIESMQLLPSAPMSL